MLVPAIYAKAIEIGITSLDDKAAVTLMSTDIERISAGFAVIHELWSNLILIVSSYTPGNPSCLLTLKGIATWLLELQIGLASIAPILVATSKYG